MTIKLQSFLRYRVPVLLFSLLVVTACGDEIPVRELTSARNELALAAQESGEDTTNGDLEKAKELLVAAHDAVAAGEYETAKTKAEEAFQTARSIRLKFTYNYTLQKKEQSEASLVKAKEAGITEDTAASLQDSLALADRSFQEGEAIRTSTEENGASASPDQQSTMLSAYRSAYQGYIEADKNAVQEKRTIITARYELERKLNDIERRLDKAAGYGADVEDPENYGAARTAISDARFALDARNDELASSRADEASRLTDELYASAVRRRSEELAAQAREELQRTEVNRNKTFPSAPTEQGEKQDLYTRSGEYLVAAREAMDSCDQNRKEKKYDYAADDAREVLHLTSIINEQLKGVSGAPTAVVAERATSSESPVPPEEDRSTYTVQSKRPAESLWAIAGKPSVYGKPTLWRKIYRANRDIIKDPNLIYPGQKLKIPPVER